MLVANTLNVDSVYPLGRHEAVDIYWQAETLRHRVSRVVADARCKSTIGRRLDTALGRAIRCIGEAANEAPDRADARLAQARAALALASIYYNELFLKRGVRDVVIADLRHWTALLVARIGQLEGKPVETWAASNCLPTVLDEVKKESGDQAGIDAAAALAKVPAAAVREVPQPVVAETDRVAPPARPAARAAKPRGDRGTAPVAIPTN